MHVVFRYVDHVDSYIVYIFIHIPCLFCVFRCYVSFFQYVLYVNVKWTVNVEYIYYNKRIVRIVLYYNKRSAIFMYEYIVLHHA